MNNILFTPIPIEDLKEVFRDCIRAELQTGIPTASVEVDEFITEKEARQLLRVSKVTLKKWRDTNKIPFYRYGSRIRYKKNELLNGLSQDKKKARRASAL